jgi:hypothetical protein
VLAPLADFPHIDLRTPGEPWETRRAAGKQEREGRARHAGDPQGNQVGLSSGLRLLDQPHRIGARTPTSGIDVVMNGDAHISNFGLFGTPQRDIVLDLKGEVGHGVLVAVGRRDHRLAPLLHRHVEVAGGDLA